jgi:hypothetical protein
MLNWWCTKLVGFKRLIYGLPQFQNRIQNSWAKSEAKIMNNRGRGEGTTNTQNKYQI